MLCMYGDASDLNGREREKGERTCVSGKYIAVAYACVSVSVYVRGYVKCKPLNAPKYTNYTEK